MKRLLSLLLAVSLILTMFSAFAFSAEAATSTKDYEFYYSDEKKGYVVTDYTGSEMDITLPSAYKGKKVVAVQSMGYESAAKVQSIVVPKTVTTIGYAAFSDCTNLESIELGSNVKSIHICSFGSAYGGTKNLKSITVQEDNSYYCDIDGVLFSKDGTVLSKYPASKDGKTYTVPSGVKRIGALAFVKSSKLQKIVLPRGVITLGGQAFSGCSSLKKIVIPASMKDLSYHTFECPKLNDIYFEGTKAQWKKLLKTYGKSPWEADTSFLNAKIHYNYVYPVDTFSLTAGSKRFTVDWSKQGGIGGYQFQYSTDKKFSKGNTQTVTIKNAKKLSKTVKKLSGKTKYYVRIRTFKKVSGKTYFSDWSAIKSVKTKA